jgi:cytochrome b561
MVTTGFATGRLAGLPEIVFAESGAPLYHQLVRKDGLLARMSFGRA